MARMRPNGVDNCRSTVSLYGLTAILAEQAAIVGRSEKRPL